ncbi:YhbY family RNA-binding protein [Candidatus Woesearchaeota archaeon]|nr:YhbY family RNA-binding protein [Candidatus Woesearchaeota archaeon]
MDPSQKKAFAGRAKALPALLQIGKNGITDAFIAELATLAEKRGLVKVRLLKSFAESNDARAAADELASRAGLLLVSAIGNTIVVSSRTKQ